MRIEQAQAEQRIWDTIRAFKAPFTRALLADRCKQPDRAIDRFLRALRNGGYLTQADAPDGSTTWRLERDVGQEAPQLTVSGQPAEQRYGAEQMWRVMRANKKDGFAAADLGAHATEPLSPTEVRNYINILLSCGYLKVIQKSAPRSGRVARYRLIKDTGPIPPRLQNVRQLYDPNTDQAVLPGGPA